MSWGQFNKLTFTSVIYKGNFCALENENYSTLANYSCKTFIKLALGSLLTSLQSYENNLKLFVRVKVCET